MENAIKSFQERESDFTVDQYRDKILIKAYHVIDLAENGREFYADYNKKTGVYYEPTTYVDCRIYASQNYQTKYAIIWTGKGDGKGKAGGYGYDKDSAAVGSAIRDAGYFLEHNINGVGEDAIVGALLAVAAYNGCKKPCIVKAFA